MTFLPVGSLPRAVSYPVVGDLGLLFGCVLGVAERSMKGMLA
jgi:hypothetical protein